MNRRKPASSPTARLPGSKNALHLLGLLLILLIWIVAALWARSAQGKPFPYPWEAAAALFNTGQGKAGMGAHLAASLLRWGTGFLIAAAVGIWIGILMGLFPDIGELLSPLVHTLQLIPGLAWIPIALILFGLGTTATIFMIAASAVAPVIITARAGIRQIDPLLLQAAAMMELGRRKTFFRVLLPGAAPSIVSGLRVASANGFRVLISAEMVIGTGLGLGYSLLQARWNLDFAAAFGTVLVIAGTGLIFEKLVFLPLERRVQERRGLK